MHKNSFIIAAVFVLMLTATAYAGTVSVGLKAGTLGAGLEAETSFSDSIGGRIGINVFEYDYDGTKDDIEYVFEFKLLSVSALLDWHPFQGSFRLTGGVLYNGNEIDADAKSSAAYEIGGTTYTASQVGSLTDEIDFNDIAPYAGIGWDTTFGKDSRFGLLIDLGVLFQGPPEVDLTVDGPIAVNQAFQNDLANEEENVQDDIDDFEYYPVISIGLAYRF